MDGGVGEVVDWRELGIKFRQLGYGTSDVARALNVHWSTVHSWFNDGVEPRYSSGVVLLGLYRRCERRWKRRNSLAAGADQDALSISQVASYLSVSESFVYRLRKRGGFPSPRSVEVRGAQRRERWSAKDIEAWLDTLPSAPRPEPQPSRLRGMAWARAEKERKSISDIS